MRTSGVCSRGIVMPIFRRGDELVPIIAENLIAASKNDGFKIETGDIIGVTEAVVARTQGNYATLGQIAADVRAKLGGGHIGVVFPILSRNRIAIVLRAFAAGCEKLTLQLSYPSDEVGNMLFSLDALDASGVDPFRDSLDEARYRAVFGHPVHRFTGIDYVEYYKSLAPNIEIVFSNNPEHILEHTSKVICADIHTAPRTKSRILKADPAATVLTLDQIMNAPVDGSGYNEDYGVWGSNKATEESVKLFPRDCRTFVNALQQKIKELTGSTVEVLVYGDGGFKDPVGGIWELADPVVSPAYTSRLSGTPNELKMKYFADNELKDLKGEALASAMREMIRGKDSSLVGSMASQGTTPRQLSDLVGSLCDLTSGSGDRGTPVVYIKGYFTNYASE